jgi:sulfofructose kinase
MFDIIGIGGATVDDLLVVDTFPDKDSKKEMQTFERHGGGVTTTALVAAARLGARCGYVDVMGDDELSNWVVDDLAREGVDTSMIIRREGAKPIHAFVLVAQDDGTRTIVYSMAGRLMRDDDIPDATVLRGAQVLMIDDVNDGAMDGIYRAVQDARAQGIAVVADIEKSYRPALLALVDHVVLSAPYAAQVTGLSDPKAAATALWQADRAAVVVTDGAVGCWYTQGGEPQFQPSYRVKVVDTTGCGDVFHGAYAAALTWGAPLVERVKMASAAAALKATKLGGRAGIPTRKEAETFIKEREI